tara:strand:- start:33602 stop:33892 length:291 start_codon:yes stop_codon:yes gene_type:complete
MAAETTEHFVLEARADFLLRWDWGSTVWSHIADNPPAYRPRNPALLMSMCNRDNQIVLSFFNSSMNGNLFERTELEKSVHFPKIERGSFRWELKSD